MIHIDKHLLSLEILCAFLPVLYLMSVFKYN